MKTNFPFKTILFFTLLLQSSFGFAQFVEFGPVHRTKNVARGNSTENSRTVESNVLPFWDDFSRGIDTLKWKVEGVSYTETIGINAPSVGMALFNGVNESGVPYSLQIRDQGESDYLTSRPFDLSGIDPSQRQSLYLSFFWQAGGKAEAPDESDRLSLQILNPEGSWQTVWFQRGGEEVNRTRFFQEIIQIRPEWQHSAFQFRFFSNGRQSGPFDSWLLDYIYLNVKRSPSNLTYPDRALTQSNQVRLDGFGAYPWELMEKHQGKKWTAVKNEFLNLDSRFRAMEYSILAADTTGRILSSINANTPFNPVPNSLERRSFLSRTFDEIPLLSQPGDLIFKTYLTTGDGFLFEINQGDTIRYPGLDYRVNDTIQTRFPVRDYFAYDHGDADYAAGINQRSGQLAVQYESPEPVFIKGISIYFTDPTQANQAIDLVIWEDLSLKPIYSKEFVIPVREPGQKLVYFPIEERIEVSSEFFVGFTQFTNSFIQVGLDKLNDQGDKIFYNVGGGWAQNTEVLGSLMIRPHVSKFSEDGGNNLPDAGFRIFPNPVVDELMIEGEFIDLKIVDSFGREILLPREQLVQGEMINFRGQRPGIYVLNLITTTGPKSFRILVKK
ncbi:T9SS type A sorting domain-containing protein [Algoriphagus sp. AK58]|uniref:T9SS type A sorting domain-containing protein n=1 Tax=Algoriphagus sp. AK58 TaxID=1406877 RepID=UPI00164FA05B|nr:T9SS type A sorting domain-containing protein [Algoriphagus sp. AK58]MBC6365239.1 T9SS C-terminal target domain-containing protein [Algoriphagus sp. AK58]